MQENGDSDDAEWVTLDVEYVGPGGSDLLSVMVDADTRIVDFKRSLHSNFSSQLCDADRMQLWWRGQELVGSGDETLSMYGIDRTVERPRILLKETAGDRYQESFGRGLSLDGPVGQGYGKAQYGMAGEGNDPVTSSLLSLVNDPAQLKHFIESNPQMQEMLKTNPEVIPPPGPRERSKAAPERCARWGRQAPRGPQQRHASHARRACRRRLCG